MIVTSVYLNPDAMDGVYEEKQGQWKQCKIWMNKKHLSMNMTISMWLLM